MFARGQAARPSFIRAAPADLLFGGWSVAVAIAIVAGAVAGGFFAPTWGGSDAVLCWLRRMSGLPCPGCGLTRSVISLARGELARSLTFHPFGVLILPWAGMAASFPVWPLRLKDRAKRRLERSARALDRGYRALVYAFIAYGTLRMGLVAFGHWPLG